MLKSVLLILFSFVVVLKNYAQLGGDTVCLTYEQYNAGDDINNQLILDGKLRINLFNNSLGKIRIIKEGETPSYYSITGNSQMINGCLNTKTKSYGAIGDENRNFNIDFEVQENNKINDFSIKLLDYGDYNPHYATYHKVKLSAFSNGVYVSGDSLIGTNYNLYGDACGATCSDATTNTKHSGCYTLSVHGENIDKVEIRFYYSNTYGVFNKSSDPNIVLSDICMVFQNETNSVPCTYVDTLACQNLSIAIGTDSSIFCIPILSDISANEISTNGLSFCMYYNDTFVQPNNIVQSEFPLNITSINDSKVCLEIPAGSNYNYEYQDGKLYLGCVEFLLNHKVFTANNRFDYLSFYIEDGCGNLIPCNAWLTENNNVWLTEGGACWLLEK